MAVEIIMKKMQRCLNATPSSLLFGDVRTQMKNDLLDTLTQVVDKKSDYEGVYYIMVYASLDMGVAGHKAIKEKILILPQKPLTKYIGTLLFKVDNKNSDATLEWCLPLDIPMPANLLTEKEVGGARVLYDAKGLPILNRGVK